jgi:hypothetical protein
VNIIETLRAEARKFSVWVYAGLLAMLPYADSIMLAVNEHLPSLAQYLPENIYKAMGAVVVVCNIVRSAYHSHKGTA